MVQASIFVHIHNVYRFVIFFYIFLGLNIQQKSKRIRDLYLYIRYRVYFTLLVPKDLLYVQDFCFSVARVSILSRIFYFFCIISSNTELKLLFLQQIYPHYYPSISCLLSRCYERVLWTPVLGWKWHMQFFLSQSKKRQKTLGNITFSMASAPKPHVGFQPLRDTTVINEYLLLPP